MVFWGWVLVGLDEALTEVLLHTVGMGYKTRSLLMICMLDLRFRLAFSNGMDYQVNR